MYHAYPTYFIAVTEPGTPRLNTDQFALRSLPAGNVADRQATAAVVPTVPDGHELTLLKTEQPIAVTLGLKPKQVAAYTNEPRGLMTAWPF